MAVSIADRLSMKAHMLATLEAEQRKRSWRTTEEWKHAELLVMSDAVNEERAKRRLNGVTLNELRRVEALAVGHSDYSSKFALYCAELALGER